MTSVAEWGARMLIASTLAMVVVLAVRTPARRVLGARLSYLLWALPVLRIAVPTWLLQAPFASRLGGLAAGRIMVLAVGAPGIPALSARPAPVGLATVACAIWMAGAAAVLLIQVGRHTSFCARLRRDGQLVDRVGSIQVLVADVDAPVAFGVLRRFVAVPRDFLRTYDARERRLVLAHECAHHARGDLVANWIALILLAAHWWNPVCWVAERRFRDDQEYAADAHVLAHAGRADRRLYGTVLAKAAGVDVRPACGLAVAGGLKARLAALDPSRRPSGRPTVRGGLLALLCIGAMAVTAAATPPSGEDGAKWVSTIGVKPDGTGAYVLIVGGIAIAPGTPLPDGDVLPTGFVGAGGCDTGPHAEPVAMAIKGEGTPSYAVLCASAAPASVSSTLMEGLASLRRMRTAVASQPSSPRFSEAERGRALATIDRSMGEVERTRATMR